MIIEEQERVLQNNKKNMLVSASAGSGKTYVMIKLLSKLICEEKIPVKDFLVLTFTKAAAVEMKERLQKRLREMGNDPFVASQIDALSTSNISTIHSFCEKNLKKYANLLKINANFAIADENLAQKIRQESFDLALKKFEIDFQQEYFDLMSSFKNDKDKLKEIMFEIEVLTNSIADKENFLNKNLKKSEMFFDKAVDYLFFITKKKLNENLDRVEGLHVDDFLFVLKNSLSKILQSKDIFEMSFAAKDFSFPFLPKRKEVGDEIVDMLQTIKENINKTIKNICDMNLDNKEIAEFQKNANLEKLLIKLFFIYETEETSLKKSQNRLDFYDLEKYMKILSVQENLFAGIKYVFIDEYQDTNKVQEKIIKNVAKNCNFIAVGDIKQGIYGFRLASSEIFLKDLKNFEKDENSVVNFLQSNFRSSQKVLDFVNDIFKICMTEAVAGVDYEKSSMLKGMSEFLEDGVKPINLDLIAEGEKEILSLPEIYSVKDAQVYVDNQNLLQLEDIKRRINEVLSSKISENGNLRQCRYSDIAILSRKRDSLYNQLEGFLQESGVPVVSNSRNTLLDEPEVKVLLSFLKIAQNFDDDIALLSVLMSGLCDISLKTILEEKSGSDLSLCEIVQKDEKGAFINFNRLLKNFKFNVPVFGIRKAFLQLFNETGYKAYIYSKDNHSKTNLFVEKFLSEISSGEFEFDLAGLINYFETVDITVNSEISASEDAVLLTTIHNSKGLEYPIVFLIGCDQSLKKSRPKVDIEINEDFGLAVKFYDKDNNNEIVTAKMKAITEFESQKDFVEELMIFYVALTRAKNRIYMFGNLKDSIFEKFSVKECDSYFELVFFALPQIKKILQEKSFFEDERVCACVVDEIEREILQPCQSLENMQSFPEVQEKIKKYLDFEYKFAESLNFKLKESVTNLSNKHLEDSMEKFSNESFSFGGVSVEIGNAYHLALKILNFDNISSLEDLNLEILKHKDSFDQIEGLVSREVLFANVSVLKKFTENSKVFKEKEFIMKDKLCNLIPEINSEDAILVQGVVDLFVVKDDEIILIDYKFSNSDNDEYLIKKYKNQLKLYKIALENALGKNIFRIFLLSLRSSKLIELRI